MRSTYLSGVAAVALSLGIGGALAAPPTFNLQGHNTLDVQKLMPSQTNSSLAATKNITPSNGLTTFSAARSEANMAARIADVHAARLANLTAPSQSTVTRQAAMDALRPHMSTLSKGLAALKRSPGLANQTAKLRMQNTATLISSLPAQHLPGQ